jgi:hypothetical protein
VIKQAATGLNSRSEANPYNEYGFLPLITAPMYSVVDETNYQVFLDNKIQVCLPRAIEGPKLGHECFLSYSLQEFIENFCNPNTGLPWACKICIDTANGNMPALHDAIRKAKKIHGDKLVIMAGNVATSNAFAELAKTGVDYIRVGIGGGGGCNTTSNTGVGQTDLQRLINDCKERVLAAIYREKNMKSIIANNKDWEKENYSENHNLCKVKIVADGISTYIKQCEKQYGWNDNGYAAINSLLYAGADLVMIGGLFAQCLESSGEKSTFTNDNECIIIDNKDQQEILFKDKDSLFVKYAGMSTQTEQRKYKQFNPKNGDFVKIKVFSNWSEGVYIGLDVDKESHLVKEDTGYILSSKQIAPIETITKPSEGSIKWLPVRWTLNEWLNGSDNQDEYPYLMGWVNSIKSAMAYTCKTKLYGTN